MQYFCIIGYIIHKYAIYSSFYQVYAKKTVYAKSYPHCLLLLLLKISKKIDIYYTRTRGRVSSFITQSERLSDSMQASLERERRFTE